VFEAAGKAEAAAHADPRTACFYARRALELAVAWAYKHDPTFKQAAGEAVFSKQPQAECDIAENLFYVFVLIDALDAPQYYVVPRSTVATFVRESHKEWLAAPGKSGQPHMDTDMRHAVYPDSTRRLRKRKLLPTGEASKCKRIGGEARELAGVALQAL
jgi:hypothetical protein